MKYATAHYGIYILINLFQIGTLNFYATKFDTIKVDLIKKMLRWMIRLWYINISRSYCVSTVYIINEEICSQFYRDANVCTISQHFPYFYFTLRNFKCRADRAIYFSILLCARISRTSTISVRAILAMSRLEASSAKLLYLIYCIRKFHSADCTLETLKDTFKKFQTKER